ncbi:MAG TPA: phosphoglucosamine mutase [Fimbriimonadaceae bacterium]|nr:phosphoglucosamine mutase [Fimbriimonadaceae bacterium]
MSARLFGTDGVRGIANEKITPELAFQIGTAAGTLLAERAWPRRALLGRDTRQSGSMLSAALAAGFCATGVDVDDLGVVPTGCVAHLVAEGPYGIAAVLSASHNPAPDNGIKLLAHDGRKVDEEFERHAEGRLETEFDRAKGADVGRIATAPGIDRYFTFLDSIVPERLEGLKIAVDGAHGAAHAMGAAMLRRLGAEVVETGNAPNGMNINAEGGATKPATIQQFTVQSGSDVGLAFDGDADRVVFSDERGRLFNGDRTMGVWCAHWSRHGGLDPGTVVGTVMSNGGFERYLAENGVRLDRTDVGDKYVSRRMGETGARIGGEQSGHIVFAERGVTGDGLVTALEFLRVLRREGRPASSFFDDYAAWPQVLLNITVAQREGWDQVPGVPEAIAEAESRLQGRGRLNVRPSGTQPMLRVMVEADDEALRDTVANQLYEVFATRLGAKLYGRVDLTHALGD